MLYRCAQSEQRYAFVQTGVLESPILILELELLASNLLFLIEGWGFQDFIPVSVSIIEECFHCTLLQAYLASCEISTLITGKHEVHATFLLSNSTARVFFGIPILRSPFDLVVSSGISSHRNSIVRGKGLSNHVAGDSVSVLVYVQDFYGNIRTFYSENVVLNVLNTRSSQILNLRHEGVDLLNHVTR